MCILQAQYWALKSPSINYLRRASLQSANECYLAPSLTLGWLMIAQYTVILKSKFEFQHKTKRVSTVIVIRGSGVNTARQ
jgi:hypothetical protein